MPDTVNAALPEMPITGVVADLLGRLDASLGDVSDALALPPECYTSPEWYEFERRAVFDRDWMVLAHVGTIPDNGDYVSVEVNGEPLLVVRGRDGEVRVLSSVCRHRGHVLGTPAGNAKGFTCPFHAWSYDLEGNLTAAPEMNGTLPFEELKKTACLPRFRSEIWNGFVFANLDGHAAPLAPRLQGLSALVANHGMGELGAIATVDWEGNHWNWKFMQENAMEPYHTSYLHSGIHDFAPAQNCDFTEWDDSDDAAIYREVRFTHLDGGFNVASKALFPPIPTLTEAERSRIVFAAVMPNLFLGAQGDVVFYYLILPQSADAITLRVGLLTTWDNLAHPNAPALLRGTLEGIGIFNEQDVVANTQTARGMHSRLAPRSRWAPAEKTLVQLNAWLIKRYKSYAQSLAPMAEAAE
jgi:phenylpropionate dioxygenase-like ring-hydroxylating dioxygenase large terminal subunit